MNKLEKIIYDVVKSNPKIKLFIRNIYQSFFDALPRRKEYSINPIQIKEGYFFGFHDQQPFSVDGEYLLANKLHMDLEMPKREDFMDVGFFEFKNGKAMDFVKLGETNAWNYHKGCRLQWVDIDRVIFNCTRNDQLGATILNVKNKEEREISFPIDSVSHDGRFATSFSYERLEKFMPGYGYCHNDSISFLEEQSPSGSGFYLVDLTTNTSKMIISLEGLASQIINDENTKGCFHYVTHSLFSPDGKYISFFHRWVGDETRKRFTRLMIYNVQSGELSQLPTGYMVSHYVWNSRNEIIVYCNHKEQDSHVLLKVEDIHNSHSVGYPTLNSDGHQSFVNDNFFVTDTYADKWRMSKLYTVDIVSDDVKLIASVYSPEKFQTKVANKHIACDLHPRVSRDGKYVVFDTVKSGKRSLAVMALCD